MRRAALRECRSSGVWTATGRSGELDPVRGPISEPVGPNGFQISASQLSELTYQVGTGNDTITTGNGADELLSQHATALGFFNAMVERFPDRLNPGALWLGAAALYR